MSSLNPHLTTHRDAWTGSPRTGESLRVRARVLFSRAGLDARLAEGGEPSESPALSLRARQLLRSGHRLRLADSIDDAISIAEGSGPRVTSTPPLARRDVRAARAALLDLARSLRECESDSPQGVAIAQRLITDGTGPLYVESQDPDALWQLARRASDALRA